MDGKITVLRLPPGGLHPLFILNYFSNFGPVKSCVVTSKSPTNWFAFVEFVYPWSAPLAVHHRPHMIMCHPVKVAYTRSKARGTARLNTTHLRLEDTPKVLQWPESPRTPRVTNGDVQSPRLPPCPFKWTAKFEHEQP